MEKCQHRIELIVKEFEACHHAFVAIGDETRLLIIMKLLESDCNGIRVGEITEKTHLSRPAVSHHLKILKEAGLINMRREGTKNYYYLDANESQWGQIARLVNHIYEVVKDFAAIDKRKGDE